MFKKFSYFFSFSILFISFLFSFSNNSSSFFYWPSDTKTISSPFSIRTLDGYNSTHFHNGIDIAAREGSAIYAIASGTVVFADFYNAYGYTIMISHYDGYKSQYSHMNPNFKVHLGEYINAKEVIGTVGPKYLDSNSIKYYLSPGNVKTNGMTTGPHLHFTLYKDNKAINPLNFEYN